MASMFKTALLCTAFVAAGCQTANIPAAFETASASDISPLINRSEVTAVTASIDVAVDLEQQAARWGYALKRKEVLGSLGLYLLTFDCPPGIDPYVASLELEKLQPKSSVEANHKYTLESANKVPSSDSQSLPIEYANALVGWPEDGCDAQFRIGIIDGGIDEKSALVNSTHVVSQKFIPGESAEAALQHGSAIAQLLVGPGRLKNADLYSASVIAKDDNGQIYSGVEPMLKALNWMVQSGVRVVNISLAGPYNRNLERGIQSAVDKGMIIVAAVGNKGPLAAPQYPAAFKEVIAATAVDRDLNVYKKAVRGGHVDVSAPGVEVFLGAGDGGRYLSGTSIAAPFVVAEIASDSRFEQLRTVSDVKDHLFDNVTDIGPNGRDPIYGNGIVKQITSCK